VYFFFSRALNHVHFKSALGEFCRHFHSSVMYKIFTQSLVLSALFQNICIHATEFQNSKSGHKIWTKVWTFWHQAEFNQRLQNSCPI